MYNKTLQNLLPIATVTSAGGAINYESSNLVQALMVQVNFLWSPRFGQGKLFSVMLFNQRLRKSVSEKKEFQLNLGTLSPVAFPSGSDGTPVEANLWNLKASLTNQPDKDGGLGMPRLLCPSES